MSFTWKDIAYGPTRKVPLKWHGAAEELRRRGLSERLTVSRAIEVESEETIRWNNIGACWTDDADSARMYHSGSGYRHALLRLSGDVKAEDVDWEATLWLRSEAPDENEIRLLPGAVVSVFLIERWSYYHQEFRGDELRTPKLARVSAATGTWEEDPHVP